MPKNERPAARQDTWPAVVRLRSSGPKTHGSRGLVHRSEVHGHRRLYQGTSDRVHGHHRLYQNTSDRVHGHRRFLQNTPGPLIDHHRFTAETRFDDKEQKITSTEHDVVRSFDCWRWFLLTLTQPGARQSVEWCHLMRWMQPGLCLSRWRQCQWR